MGKTGVEDAFQRLDVLTKEENLMTTARTFETTHNVDVHVKATQELTHHIDNNVAVIEEVLHQVDSSIRVTQELTYDVRADIDVIKEDTRSVEDNVKVTKRGTPIVFGLDVIYWPFSYPKTVIEEIQSLLLPDTAMINHRV